MKYIHLILILCVLVMPVHAKEHIVIYAKDLKSLVVEPVLKEMDAVPGWRGMYSEHAVNLLVGTLYQESTIGGKTHLKQYPTGEGLGPYQIETDTAVDQYVNYLLSRHRYARLTFMVNLFSRAELSDSQLMLILTPVNKRDQSYEDFEQIVVAILRGAGVRSALMTNLRYATAAARLKYWRRTFNWPTDPADIGSLAVIWNVSYNANPDHGTPEQYMAKFPLEVL